MVGALQDAVKHPGTHQYPSNRGLPGAAQGVRELLRRPLRRGARPRDRGRARARRQGVHLQPEPGLPRPGHVRAGGRPRLPGLHGRPAAGRRRGGADAAAARARLRARPRGDLRRGRRAGAADVPQLPEQPDRRRGAGRAVRARGRVRARARRAGGARRLLHRDHLRRLRGAELPRDAGREGRRGRGVLALQGLEHDRLAHRGDRRQRRRRGRLLAPEDEHRLRHVRGGAACRRGGTRARRATSRSR